MNGVPVTRPAARWRDIDGILLLDKPEGLTSNAALQRLRRLFNARKAGHTGSLDPLASGPRRVIVKVMSSKGFRCRHWMMRLSGASLRSFWANPSRFRRCIRR